MYLLEGSTSKKCTCTGGRRSSCVIGNLGFGRVVAVVLCACGKSCGGVVGDWEFMVGVGGFEGRVCRKKVSTCTCLRIRRRKCARVQEGRRSSCVTGNFGFG